MRLYFQLTDAERTAALKTCETQTITEILAGRLFIEPVTDSDFELFDLMEVAMRHIETLSGDEAKITYLLGDPRISEAITDIAAEMVRNILFLEDDETPMYRSSLVTVEMPKQLASGEEAEPEETNDVEDEFFDLRAGRVKTDPYGLN